MATESRRVSSPPVPLSPLTTGPPTSNGSANLMSPSRSSATRHEHPYAFKSTSSAILTRSNSIGNNSRHTHHSYAPPTPQTPGLSRSQTISHRHTRSLSNVAPPAPLPMPPSPSIPVRLGSFDASSPTPFLDKRHETPPSIPPLTQTTNELKISDLPDNPKLWTPTQLSLYLMSSLRFRRGGAVPLPVAKDIAAWVMREKLGGKRFLRLTGNNLSEMGINQLWREALLDASRILRKKVLQGRIWGFGHIEVPSDDDDYPPSPTKHHKSKHGRIPTTVDEDTESEAIDEQPVSPLPGGYRRGRVRSMIETLERSGSSASGSEHIISPTEDPGPEQDDDIKNELKAAGLWFDEVEDDLQGGITSDEISTSPSASEGEEMEEVLRSDKPTSNGVALTTDKEPTVQELLAQERQDISGDLPIVDSTIKERTAGHLKTESGWIKGQKPSFGAWAWERADEGLIGGTAKKFEGIAPTVSMPPISPTTSTSISLSDMLAPTPENEDDNTWALIESLKGRLEVVERRVVDIEKKDQIRDSELKRLRGEKKQWANERQQYIEKLKDQEQRLQASLVLPDTDRDFHTANETEANETEAEDASGPTSLAALVPSILTSRVPVSRIPSVFRSLSKPASGSAVVRRRRNREAVGKPEDPDPNPADLPTYILLVSLGVCAVVVRVIFRKLSGNTRRG